LEAGLVPVGPVSGSFSVFSLADVETLITDKRDEVDRPKLDWTEWFGKSGRVELVFFEEEYLHLVSVLSFSYNSFHIPSSKEKWTSSTMDDKIQPHPTRSSNSASVEGGRISPSNDEAKEIRTLPEDRQGPAWELSQMSPEEYRAFEKKTLWKMDLRIIPWITSVFDLSSVIRR
jgi:hypothetical protein